MNKKLIQKLVIASYKNNKLDKNTTEVIAQRLTRKKLRMYINALKQYEKQKNIYVDCSFTPTKEQEDMLRDTYPDRDLIFRLNQDLILGIRITDNDIVTDLNIKTVLNKLEEFIEQQYD